MITEKGEYADLVDMVYLNVPHFQEKKVVDFKKIDGIHPYKLRQRGRTCLRAKENLTIMPPKKETLTVDALKQLWESEFLPSIRSEFKKEIDHIKRELNSLTQKCNEIEKSQSFLATEYDNVKTSIQTTKKEVMETAKSLKEVEVKIKSADDRIYDQDTRMDNIEQYLRRDCIEITGIPTVSQDNPKQIAVELGEMLGIEVTEHHISIAHRLPPTRKIRNRIIVKFVHRNMKEEFYKRRSKLIGKKSKDIPSVAKEYGKTIHESNSIFINESLTSCRKKLLGRVNEYRRSNRWKHIWTINGKILLRQSDN
jgi:hypothetical protein